MWITRAKHRAIVTDLEQQRDDIARHNRQLAERVDILGGEPARLRGELFTADCECEKLRNAAAALDKTIATLRDELLAARIAARPITVTVALPDSFRLQLEHVAPAPAPVAPVERPELAPDVERMVVHYGHGNPAEIATNRSLALQLTRKNMPETEIIATLRAGGVSRRTTAPRVSADSE